MPCKQNRLRSLRPKEFIAQEFIAARLRCNIMSVYTLKTTEDVNWPGNSSQHKHSGNRDSRL